MIQWVLNQILRVDLSFIGTKRGIQGSGTIQTYGNLQSGSQRSWWPVCSSLSAWKWPLSQDRCCADIMHVARIKNCCASHYSRSVVSKNIQQQTSCPCHPAPKIFPQGNLTNQLSSTGSTIHHFSAFPANRGAPWVARKRRWVVLMVCDQGTVLEVGSLPWVSWTWGIMKLQPNWKA